ncbi:DnaB-like helicase C-terminal domain-containing protein [Borreliella garinii]|uniref:DnaB-like helicase C-terminal domain-containing protein n=1 Tax=Borreliella garinii TaxID=29519 RepID=UPI001F3036F2|nr:DnaB-like helicase C-terminal domain-containing protein [Borreliella garinii]
MVNLHQKGVSIDPIIVLDDLVKNNKSNGPFFDFKVREYVETISTYATVDAIVETHCNIIRDCSVRRAVISMVDSIARLATDRSVGLETLLDNVQNRVNLLEISYKSKSLSSSDAVDIAHAINSDIQNRNFTENDYISSGFVGLDRIIKGFKKSSLVIVGARPSVGKTAFALNIANNLCLNQGSSVGFFTLEVSSKSIVVRLMAMNSGVEYHKICNNILMNENERLMCDKAYSKFKNFKMRVDETCNIDIHELKSKARKMKKDYGVEIIFIDYISLIFVAQNNTPRYEQVAFLSKNLRALALALELGIPIIVLSQLTRSAEGKEPSLANLRESGAIEQDADTVIFLHRENEELQDDCEEVRKVKVIVAKNRDGHTGVVTMDFVSKYTRFVDYFGVTCLYGVIEFVID